MIRKLQRKLTVILAVILFLILLMSLFLLDAYTYHSYEKQYQADRMSAEKKVRRLFRDNVKSSNEDKVIEQVRAYKNVYAVVVDDEGNIVHFIYGKGKYETVQKAVQSIWSTDRVREWRKHSSQGVAKEEQVKTGFFGGSIRGKLQGVHYRVSMMKDGTLVSYYDERSIYKEMEELGIYSCVALVVGMILILFISRFLALTITRPVEESYYRQKRFIADASHELKTPLAVISVNMEMLIKNPSNTKYMYYIQQESRKMNRLIEELLVMASIDEEEGHIRKEIIDISDVVEGAVEPFEAVAYENGVTLEMQIEPGIYYRADADKLQRLVGILLDNGIKHAEFEKKVIVKLQSDKNYIELFVCNTGREIAKEDQKRIFDRFYRANKARSRSEGRYGLGLSIAKAIVQQHRGRIQVKSADGRTCFRVSFFHRKYSRLFQERTHIV